MVSVKVDDTVSFPINAVPTNPLPPSPVTVRVGGFLLPEPPTNAENPVMVQGQGIITFSCANTANH